MRPKKLVVVTLLSALSLSAIAADLPCDPVSIAPETLPPAHLASGVGYGPITVSASPLAYYHKSISEGVLPAGLSLTNSYANHVDLAGEAAEPGYFIFTITASDPFTGCSGGRIFAVQVFECGDGTVDTEVGEVCDEGDTISGDGCSSNCLSDETCGNNYVDLDEQCDGSDLKGADCTTVGLVDGVLACTPGSCVFDTSGCLTCGNGVIDPGEQCDGSNLQGFDCAALGLIGGVLACHPEMCTFDTSGCISGRSDDSDDLT